MIPSVCAFEENKFLLEQFTYYIYWMSVEFHDVIFKYVCISLVEKLFTSWIQITVKIENLFDLDD